MRSRAIKLRSTFDSALMAVDLDVAAADDDVSEEFDALAEKQRLKAALHHSAGRVCAEVEGTEFSREVIAAVTEAAYNQSQLLAWDTEAFAKHAKRTVVGPEDVRLCCRRNDDLLTHITEQLEKLKAERETRKTGTSHRGGGGEDTASKSKKTKKRKLTDS